jgi:FAD/FMN-containing dehydrogenase/Fe-S oxidoreductase
MPTAWKTGHPPRPPRFAADKAKALAKDLAGVVRGEVRFDAGSRALYATDLSAYRQVPIGVVVPHDAEDVVSAVEACRAHDAPVLGRGAGTSLGGQTCNVAVVLDFSKYMNRLLAVDAERKVARVQPGLVGMHLRRATAERGLTWAPDPATFEYCTLGGMIVNNSCGVHSTMLGMEGRSSDSVEELEILTYRGERLRVGRGENGVPPELRDKLLALRDRYGDLVRERYPPIPRRVSGYNLDDLLPEKGFHVARSLAGTEGTCALVLEATVRLVDWPPARALVALGYPDQYSAADHLLEILAHEPIGLEAVDSSVTENLKKLRFNLDAFALYPEGGAWLLAEFGGETSEEAAERGRGLIDDLSRQTRLSGAPTMRLYTDPAEQKQVWLVRESSIGVSRVPPELETWSCWEDAAVAPERLGAYLREFKKLLDRHGYYCVFFGHYGQGCVHSRITFDLKSAEGVRGFRAFMEEASDLVLSYGGSLSGEHGDGQSHAELLPKMFGPELVEAFREFKSIWDPDFKMNPHKIVEPYPLDSNLRLGAAYRPRPVETHFRFPRDGGSFAAATERCFGVGKCRRTEGGTMCPSYMVTREEMHSTRGRAHLLFELMNGEVVGTKGWRDPHVKEALDLCLACKGCKGDCPVSVDVATYKAEFLAHYYAGRLRPPSAYALGLFHRWARLASRAPRLANRILGIAPVAAALKRVGGLAPERPLPEFAAETLHAWFARRPPGTGERRVILWPDTFTNYLHPGTGKAAIEVLEAAGYRVELPRSGLCCGRPLYDYGMLGRAKGQLREILDELAGEIEAGVPLVGLEPSCVAVFRDELVNLFPDDAAARRLSAQTFFLAEFLGREGYEPPRLAGRAVVHGHCHQKALVKPSDVEPLLSRVGLEFESLDSGCCGLAGSFGYEADHYEVSMQIGERVLLPAVRDAPPDALVVADGFSCREQIAHATGRRALHLAEVLQLALRASRD